MESSGHGKGAACTHTTHGILRTQGWGCCTLCVCVCVHNSWDPPDMGMGLLYVVCVYIYNSWDPPDRGMGLL